MAGECRVEGLPWAREERRAQAAAVAAGNAAARAAITKRLVSLRQVGVPLMRLLRRQLRARNRLPWGTLARLAVRRASQRREEVAEAASAGGSRAGGWEVAVVAMQAIQWRQQ